MAVIYSFLPPLQDIFRDGRIAVVVNKMDEKYLEVDRSAQLSEQQVKQIVSNGITEALQIEVVPPDSVIPVCGKWAMEVRVY